MKLADVSIRRPVFAVMMSAAIIVIGFASYRQLGLDLMPKTDFPMVVVNTTLPGASAEEVESQITKPVEEAVNTIAGIDELRSLNEELRRRNIRLGMMAVHRPGMESFTRSGFVNEIDSECMIDSSCLMEHKGAAITRLFSGLDHGYCRNLCPLALFHECYTVK